LHRPPISKIAIAKLAQQEFVGGEALRAHASAFEAAITDPIQVRAGGVTIIFGAPAAKN